MIKSKVFMLNVPTGGGKTNISIRLVLDILKNNQDINKAFWVFPYINIIEQNYEVIRKTLFSSIYDKLLDENISMIHSSKIRQVNSSKEDSILNDFQVYLDDLFLNNPLNIISNINFFEAFIKTKKSNRHKLAYLTNSVVVIDEIQTLKIENLDFFYNLLLDISDKYNVYFIIMSATLPDLKFFTNKEIPHLIENYSDYFNSVHFSRNSIDFLEGDYDLKKTNELILQLYKNNDYNKILVCMNTIKTSIKLFELISNIGCETILLNSLTPLFDRIKIIDYIKNTNKKVILISTQSIEAGVDLDFDVAIRDYSILDSIEQVSGRVNRESNSIKQKTSKVFVINYIEDTNYDFKKVYRTNPRLKIQEKDFNFKKNNIFELKERILKEKKFNAYYEELSFLLNSTDIKSGSLEKPLNDILTLQYENLSKEINVIDKLPKQEVYVCFPIEINPEIISILDYLETNSSKLKKQISFYQIEDNMMNINLANIFLIRNELGGFLSKPLRKRIESILSYFSVSFFIFSDEDPILTLISNDYIDENNITTNKFKEEFLVNYKIENNRFYYVNVPKLISRIKELTNSALLL